MAGMTKVEMEARLGAAVTAPHPEVYGMVRRLWREIHRNGLAPDAPFGRPLSHAEVQALPDGARMVGVPQGAGFDPFIVEVDDELRCAPAFRCPVYLLALPGGLEQEPAAARGPEQPAPAAGPEAPRARPGADRGGTGYLATNVTLGFDPAAELRDAKCELAMAFDTIRHLADDNRRHAAHIDLLLERAGRDGDGQ